MIFAPRLFDGKTAIVTGGGTGIGRATATMLAKLGARVAIASRKLEHLEGTAKELAAIAGEANVFHATCDIREPEQIAAFVGQVLERFGRRSICWSTTPAGNSRRPPNRSRPRAGTPWSATT